MTGVSRRVSIADSMQAPDRVPGAPPDHSGGAFHLSRHADFPLRCVSPVFLVVASYRRMVARRWARDRFRDVSKPLIIGIAGGSGSGKSTVAHKVASALP